MAKYSKRASGRDRTDTEIFAPEWLVRQMCDELQRQDGDVFAPERTFLEPTCGDGNFAVEILRRKYNPTEAKAEREWYKAHGICPTCRQRDAAIGFVQCPECIERESAYQAKYRERDREAYNAKRREERQRAKDRGICPRCMSNTAVPGMIMCKTCLLKNRQKWKRNYIHVVKPDGICKWCDQPVVDGKKLCEQHYATMRQVGLNMQQHVKDNWFIKTSTVKRR